MEAVWFWKPVQRCLGRSSRSVPTIFMKADRIYIFIPRYIDLPKSRYKMPAGRLGAQCAHVAAKLAKKFHNVDKMTTLIMEGYSIERLELIRDSLKLLKIKFVEQYDNLPKHPKMRLQAIATVPITKKQSQAFRNLVLWQD